MVMSAQAIPRSSRKTPVKQDSIKWSTVSPVDTSARFVSDSSHPIVQMKLTDDGSGYKLNVIDAADSEAARELFKEDNCRVAAGGSNDWRK
jgi:hypothetical protein